MAKERRVPAHIGIILDGNGRWAARRGLPRSAGHVRGADTFKKIAEYCSSIGVKAVTAYVFSTENWQRSEEEVNGIMDLFEKYMLNALKESEEGFRIRFIGRRDRLSPKLLELIGRVEEDSRSNGGMIINVAVDYGGRDEIVRAARSAAEDVAAGRLKPEEIDEQLMGSRMFTADSPDVDMILRPSGEQRLSNFLLWQAAYAELVYMDTLWPDFTPELMDEAIRIYNSRQRRFGA